MSDTLNVIKDKVLGLYLPESRLLESINIVHPHAEGIFTLGTKQYTTHEQQELSAANFIILFNQVFIVSLVYNLINKNIPEAADFNLTLDEIDYFANRIVTRKFSNLEFKKRATRTKDLTFKFNVNRVTNRLAKQQLMFFDVNFSVCDESHIGQGMYCYFPNFYEV